MFYYIMANKTERLESKLFHVDNRIIEIGMKERKNHFVIYEYVRDDKTLRSKYEIYTNKQFEARGYYHRLLNTYNKKIRDIHGL